MSNNTFDQVLEEPTAVQLNTGARIAPHTSTAKQLLLENSSPLKPN